MGKNMKKSKYAALMLASTLALSTIVTTAPEVFGGQTITAQAAPIEEDTVYSVIDFNSTAEGTIEVADATYNVKLEAGTVKFTDPKNVKFTLSATKNEIIQLNGLNLQVVDLVSNAADSKLMLRIIEQQTPAAVTEMINELSILTSSYKENVAAAQAAYDLLTENDKKNVKNSNLLPVHELLAADQAISTKIIYVVEEANTDNTIAQLNTYTSENGGIYTVKETIKGKEVVRAANKTLESFVGEFATFLETMKAEKYQTKENKKILDPAIKEANRLAKLVTAQQKIVAAEGEYDVFNNLAGALENGGKFTTPTSSVAVKKGKFKIGDDSYVVTEADGKYTVTNAAGDEETVIEKALDGGGKEYTFKVVDKDADGEEATLDDTYLITGTGDKLAITKLGETITLAKVPVLKFDSKMTVNAYKTLRAGTKKYNDNQIEGITFASNTYKALSSNAKKKVSKATVAKLKKYETALKAQQTLEKKLLSEDTKGVIKAITSLKYGPTYDQDIKDARAAYTKLTAKFKKKIPAATVTKLKDHEAAVVVTNEIDDLPVVNLLKAKTDDTAETATGLAKLKEKMKAVTAGKTGTTGSYDKLSKTQKPLVKNLTQIAALEKQIATQEKYLLKANNDAIVEWQTALEKVVRSTDIQVINNQFLIGSDVYTLEYDKKEKTSKVYKGKEAVTLTGDLKDPAKDVAKATFKVGDVTYQVSAAKGKFKVDILSATEANLVLPILDLAKVTDITKVTLYTEAEAKLIEDATTAYATVTKLKDAKPFVKAEDVAVYNKYVAALKAQKALEAKDQAAAIAFLKGKKEVTVANGKATDTAAILTAIKALDADSKYKYIKDLKATALTAGDKKVTIKVSDKLSFDLIVKEETLAPTADETAKAIIDGKYVTADKADKAAVLTAIKGLASDNTTVQALTEAEVAISDAIATVTFKGGVKATVTITPA